MKPSAILLIIVAMISPQFTPAAFSADPLKWTNPIVPQRADPQVMLMPGGTYYLAATVPEYDRIELRRATSLGGLSTAEPKVVWRKHTKGPLSGFIWAPEE